MACLSTAQINDAAAFDGLAGCKVLRSLELVDDQPFEPIIEGEKPVPCHQKHTAAEMIM